MNIPDITYSVSPLLKTLQQSHPTPAALGLTPGSLPALWTLPEPFLAPLRPPLSPLDSEGYGPAGSSPRPRVLFWLLSVQNRISPSLQPTTKHSSASPFGVTSPGPSSLARPWPCPLCLAPCAVSHWRGLYHTTRSQVQGPDAGPSCFPRFHVVRAQWMVK